MAQRARITLLGVLLAAVLAGCSARVEEIDYWQNLDRVVLELDGDSYALRDLAFYIAYEESLVEEQALLYDSSRPWRYWNGHTNGEFIRVRARTETMNMAVHDLIFYRMAEEFGLVLDEEERLHAINTLYNFWDDLSEEQQARMADVRDDMRETIVRMAYAQKYEDIYAAVYGIDIAELEADGAAFRELMEEHEIKIDEGVWEGIGFGKVTIIR